MVPASRPLMTFADTAKPDYITPRLIAANPRAKAVYDAAMQEAWDAKNQLLSLGVPLEHALYLLPNAKTLRFVESGSLLALLHKWTLRTCFNAQEEIYLASMDEIEQVRTLHPRIGRYIGPPCVIRNGLISPRCTEGTHFCGVPVWRDFPNAVRQTLTTPWELDGWELGVDRCLAGPRLHGVRPWFSRCSPLAPSSTTTTALRSSGSGCRLSLMQQTVRWLAVRVCQSEFPGSTAASSTTSSIT